MSVKQQTSSTTKKKQLKLRRIIFQNNHSNHGSTTQSNGGNNSGATEDDEQRRAILMTSSSTHARSMDTRLLSAVKQQQQQQQHESSSSQSSQLLVFPSDPTSPNALGGIEHSASAHAHLVRKKHPPVALPLLQPNARDSRKKGQPRRTLPSVATVANPSFTTSVPQKQQQQQPFAVGSINKSVSRVDPEGAVATDVAEGTMRTSSSSSQWRTPNIAVSQQQQQQQQPQHQQQRVQQKSSVAIQQQLQSQSPRPQQQQPQHQRVAPQHQQQQQSKLQQSQQSSLSPPKTADAARIRQKDCAQSVGSLPSAYGEEVSLDNIIMPDTVQHLSPISSAVVVQQQQAAQSMFLQKKTSLFSNNKNNNRNSKNRTPPRQKQRPVMSAAVIANNNSDRTPPKQRPASAADTIITTERRRTTPNPKKELPLPTPSDGTAVTQKTPIPKTSSSSLLQLQQQMRQGSDATASLSDEMTSICKTPPRGCDFAGGEHDDDKLLTLTPVKTNRSPVEHRQEPPSNTVASAGRPSGSGIDRTEQQLSTAAAASGTNQQRKPGRPPSALLKAALSRPFGREPSILLAVNPNAWVVEISTAEWDADQQQWKYRILVQRRQQQQQQQQLEQQQQQELEKQQHAASSFTAAFTWRSVEDFFWLEQSLQQEFHGALLLPILSIALGRTVEVASEMPVESAALKHWLADVLNGVRGTGEWILPIIQQQLQPQPGSKDCIDIIKSESMETFLYRNAVGSDIRAKAGAHQQNSPKSRRGGAKRDQSECNDASSFMTSLFHTAMTASPLELCVGPQPSKKQDNLHRQDYNSSLHSKSRRDDKNEKQKPDGFVKHNLAMNCSSRALGTAADLEIQDSFMDSTTSVVSGMGSPRGSCALAIHSELLFAEKALALNYRTTALTAMEKLRALYEEEEKVGVAWKRFAITLANLFSYEKDVENANLGDSKVKRENMPFRKVEKGIIDECLRVVARQKTDRAIPGLTVLSAMLSAYIADLSSVEPSVDVYAKAIKQLSLGQLPTPEELSGSNNSGGITASSASSSSCSPRYVEAKHQSSSGSSWEDLKEWTMKSLNNAKGGPDGDSGELVRRRQNAFAMQHEELKNRLLTNERLLRLSLTTMFRTAPFRISRMAWRYWNTEASHCAMMNSAAAELRSKLDIVNQNSVSKLLKRHSKEEKADCAMELELIQRVVNLGQRRKFSSGADSATDGSISTTSINNEIVEVDNDDLSEERTKAMKRDKALDIARHRIGRWNAVLAMSMMEAVGVDDPNVRVEETTRDLRLVRKYAIGLRECLNRCVESVHFLQEAITGNITVPAGSESSPHLPKHNSAPNQLKRLRNDFLVEMSLLFSGTLADGESKSIPKRSSASRAVLFNAGIDTSDPFGWIPLAPAASQRGSKSTLSKGRVGDLAVQYVIARDAQVEWLLSSLDGLLNEYYQRIEVIEGFVYMECVGIQLEKHFSAKRAKALSAFEKKTDLTTAMNMARRKRMPQLLVELQGKLEKMGREVSHTTVKETKEAHLESKNLKTSLHELAMRRLMRARETSTDRAITIMSLWAKEEEINATEEIKALGEAMSALERSVCQEDADRIVNRNAKPSSSNTK